MDQGAVPPGLRSSRGISTIWRLAERGNIDGRAKRFRLYVIEMNESAALDFYVGQTSRKVETRLAQHQSRQREQYAARVFRKGRATALKLRYDLFEGLPYFTEKETAEKAEGVLADIIEAQLHARVECNALRDRKRLRGRQTN